MTELIVDGKNVLQPVNLEKNKQEIMHQRASVPSQVYLSHFEENVGFFRANVKGDDLNGLVGQLQNCFTEINQRETKIYDELDTIFNTVESIHKGAIEGVIVGVKSAQEAIKQSDFAIEQIKETLLILQKFKKKLEENTEHLHDIDIIWDATQQLNEECSRIEEELGEKCQKLNKDIKTLTKFKEGIEKSKHLKDIDKMFQDLETLSSEVKRNEKSNLSKIRGLAESANQNANAITSLNAKYEQTHSIHETRISELEAFEKELKGFTHLLDIDKEWEYSQLLGKRMEESEKRLLEMEAMQTEISNLKHKLKIFYYVFGGTASIMILQIILSILGII